VSKEVLFERLDKFFQHWRTLKELDLKKSSTAELQAAATLVLATEQALFQQLGFYLQPVLLAHIEKLRSIKKKLLQLSRLPVSHCVPDLLLLRDQCVRCMREFNSWFPACLRLPVDSFPNEGVPLLEAEQTERNWFARQRLIQSLPTLSMVLCGESQISIEALGQLIACEINDLLLRLPSAEFNERFPPEPSAALCRRLAELPECSICGEPARWTVEAPAGHAQCSQRNSTCYECFRGYVWSKQHSARKVHAQWAPVDCAFCRQPLELDSCAVVQNCVLKRSAATSSHSKRIRLE
jgi:hypothetical protein